MIEAQASRCVENDARFSGPPLGSDEWWYTTLGELRLDIPVLMIFAAHSKLHLPPQGGTLFAEHEPALMRTEHLSAAEAGHERREGRLLGDTEGLGFNSYRQAVQVGDRSRAEGTPARATPQ